MMMDLVMVLSRQGSRSEGYHCFGTNTIGILSLGFLTQRTQLQSLSKAIFNLSKNWE